MEIKFKNVLFVTDFFYPEPTSIGVCVGNVVEEARKYGVNVSVLCYGNPEKKKHLKSETGVDIFFVKKTLGERIQSFGKKINNVLLNKMITKLGMGIIRMSQLLFFPWFRMSSILVPLAYYKEIERLYNKKKFDMVCSTHSPFHGTLGTYWFKKKYPEVFWEMYILDSLTNKGDTKFISSKTNDRKGFKWEKKFYSVADRIINIDCNEKHNKQSRYDIFRSKMYITDVPLFIPHMLNTKNQGSNVIDIDADIHIVYAGRLLSHLSSPDYLCKLLECVNKQKNNHFYVHFYSNGDCQSIIEKYSEKTYGRIIYEGLVPHCELENIYREADALVSIGSKRPDMLPSKIFEYMSTGKRILHIIKGDGDVCKEHYLKYPNALLIDERDDIETNVNKLLEFFIRPIEKVDIMLLQDVFSKNTPHYTLEIIEE